MSSLASSNPRPKTEDDKENTITNDNFTEEGEEEDPGSGGGAEKWVTTHLHLGPAHSTKTMDKDVVLRRIRQRKRANKVQAAVRGFFGFLCPANRRRTSDSPNKVPLKWVDDAFAAP